MLPILDAGMKNYAEVTAKVTDKDNQNAAGAGCLDYQTAMGKAPVGVAKLGKKYGAKTIAFAGSVMKEAVACNEAGIDAFFPIVRGISTLEEAMDPDTAKANMAATAEQVFRLL